jgi:hypothetical protein
MLSTVPLLGVDLDQVQRLLVVGAVVSFIVFAVSLTGEILGWWKASS